MPFGDCPFRGHTAAAPLKPVDPQTHEFRSMPFRGLSCLSARIEVDHLARWDCWS
jgi:hypothetical protein